ncbi:MAG: phenylalanine--tRNA ligase subunit alpha, partial [Gemmatimonadales bacterium]
MSRLDEVNAIRTEVLGRLDVAADAAALDSVRIEWLGRKAGRLTGLLKSIATVPPDERAPFGEAVNRLKVEVTARLEARKAALEAARPRRETVDVTMPGRPLRLGR